MQNAVVSFPKRHTALPAADLNFRRYAPVRNWRSAISRPVVCTHDPADVSAWALAAACFHMGWTVLWLSWRHWLAMLGYDLKARALGAKAQALHAVHSLYTAYFVGAAGFGFGLGAFAIMAWR